MADCAISVLAQQGNRALVRVTCPSCSDENLLQIIFQTEGESAASRQRRIPDEGRPDITSPISADDVLQVHELLAEHRGGFTELLTPRH